MEKEIQEFHLQKDIYTYREREINICKHAWIVGKEVQSIKEF